MRKTRKGADGTEEVLEGEPEELRKYEDLQKPQDQAPITESPKKPGILHGAPSVDGKPLTDAEVEWIRTLRKLTETPYQLGAPIWVAPQCSMCRDPQCDGRCCLKIGQPWITYGTTTGTSIKLLPDGSSQLPSLIDVLLHGPLEVKTN